MFQEIPYDRVPSDSIVEYVSLDFDKPLSFEQYNTLKNSFSSILDRIEVWRYIPFYDEDYWMYNSAMLASLLIAVVAAFNLVVLYHYVLVRRQKSLAIFQLCGCTKGRAIRLYVAESLMLTVPCYCLSAVLYHFVLLKPFTRIFPYIDTAYSLRLYATGFGIFVTVCTIAIWILSARIVSKHSIVERKGGVV
ncbi:FtsX-like permease family protein [Ruminococcus champanellensis]